MGAHGGDLVLAFGHHRVWHRAEYWAFNDSTVSVASLD